MKFRKGLKASVRIAVALFTIGLVLSTTGGSAMAAGTQTDPPALKPAIVVYNLFATDGYQTLADGTQNYVYGYVGGRAGQPLYYLKADGTVGFLPGGAPTPQPGPRTATEQLLAGNAQVPGPVIYATTNDVVQLNLKNLGVTNPTAPNDPHTIHLHGLDVDAANDGVPETSVATIPANDPQPGAGNVVVYMFKAKEAATYMYHCHQEADIHVTMGMYGALVIYDPKDDAAVTGPGMNKGGKLYGFKYDRDIVMLLSDTDVLQHISEQTGLGNYNPVDFKPQYWFINGLSFPNTVHVTLPGTTFNWTNWIQTHPGYDPLVYGSTGRSDKVLVRVINLGFETQPMHCHGFHPKVLGSDQRAWPWGNSPGTPTGVGLEKNTLTVGSGETYELLFDFSTQQVASFYSAGVQSRHDGNTPVSNTQVGKPAIVDPFGSDILGGQVTYIGGPKVAGLLGGAIGGNVSQYFPWHNHDDYKATNNGVYPGGQFTLIRIDP